MKKLDKSIEEQIYEEFCEKEELEFNRGNMRNCIKFAKYWHEQVVKNCSIPDVSGSALLMPVKCKKCNKRFMTDLEVENEVIDIDSTEKFDEYVSFLDWICNQCKPM